jgi:dihydroorotate dehydrogenase
LSPDGVRGLDTSINLAPGNERGLKLANPVMTASGTFGYGMEFEGLFDIQRLGAVVCKGTTLTPRDGNAQPRIAETPSGMLNSIGLQNVGVEAVIAEKAPVWEKWRLGEVAGPCHCQHCRQYRRGIRRACTETRRRRRCQRTGSQHQLSECQRGWG